MLGFVSFRRKSMPAAHPAAYNVFTAEVICFFGFKERTFNINIAPVCCHELQALPSPRRTEGLFLHGKNL